MRRHAERLLNPFVRPIAQRGEDMTEEEMKREKELFRSGTARPGAGAGRVVEWWADSPERQRMEQQQGSPASSRL